MSQLPGYETGRTITPREIAFGSDNLEIFPGGVVINGTIGIDGANTNFTNEIRAGWALGRITSTGKYVPCKRSQVNGTSGSVTSIVVDNAAAFAVGDTITVGADTGKVITAINYGTNTITWSGAITVADNEEVFAEDGSGTCRGFLYEFVKLRNADNTAAQDKTGDVVVGGSLNQAWLLGDIAAILAHAASVAALGGRIRIFNPSTGLYTL
jgi:hypothetical protein